MRLGLALGAVGLCALGAGCALVGNATRNAIGATSRAIESLREQQRDRELAAAAWARYAANSDHQYTSDFAGGFTDGFADYLYWGGTGDPPPVPPQRYWALRYKSAEGAEAIRQWYAGWRAGAAEACSSGLRQFVMLPSPPPAPPRDTAHPAAEPAAPAADPDKVPESVLPAPRPLPAPEEGGQLPPARKREESGVRE
jgi:hypothetical protein